MDKILAINFQIKYCLLFDIEISGDCFSKQGPETAERFLGPLPFLAITKYTISANLGKSGQYGCMEILHRNLVPPDH